MVNNVNDAQTKKAAYMQLYDELVHDICTGLLPFGSKLPTRRDISKEKNISETTVNNTYTLLQDTGYIVSRPRQGFFVSYKSLDADRTPPWELTPKEQYVFSPNNMDSSLFNRRLYAKILKEITYNDGIDFANHGDKAGELSLREEIAKYMYSFHNIKCLPSQIIIGGGLEYLLVSFAQCFGADMPHIMESPGDRHWYYSFQTYMKKQQFIPANPDCFDIDALSSFNKGILYCSPGQQIPTGHHMTMQERNNLLKWVHADNSTQPPFHRYIVEVEIHNELLSRHEPSLYSMCPDDHVVYLGSFCRALTPGFKISYMILPSHLIELWQQRHVFYYSLCSRAEQLALAEFMNRGYFVCHYESLKQLYSQKRAFCIQCLKNEFADSVTIMEDNTDGMIVIARLNLPVSDETARIKNAQAGVKVYPLSFYSCGSDNDRIPKGIYLFGIGALSNAQIKTGIHIFHETIYN